MFEDRERFFSRLSTIAGLQLMPSLGSWILVCVEDPSDLARKVNRRTEPGTISVPRQVKSAVRIPVCSPKENETLFAVIREVMELRAGNVRRVVG
jgi:histidinol-phosphate/aromatic aminotransferase/cobyric acid decarboxylase-like protein